MNRKPRWWPNLVSQRGSEAGDSCAYNVLSGVIALCSTSSLKVDFTVSQNQNPVQLAPSLVLADYKVEGPATKHSN